MFSNVLALSIVGGSPGLSLLYISIVPSSLDFVLSFCIVARTLSSSPSTSMISRSDPYPRARRRTVIGSFLVLSILTEITSLESVSYSSHAPLLGMTVDEKSFLPDLSSLSEKYIPGDLTNWLTMTLSAPLMIKVPVSVMSGKSPMNISCSLTSPVPLLIRRTFTFNGAEYVVSRSLHSSTEYLGFSSRE